MRRRFIPKKSKMFFFVFCFFVSLKKEKIFLLAEHHGYAAQLSDDIQSCNCRYI